MFKEVWSGVGIMRNEAWRTVICVGLLAGIVFTGCKNGFDEETGTRSAKSASDIAAALQSSPSTSKVGSTYKNLVGLQLNYAQKGIDTVSEYVDIPNDSERSAYGGPIAFADIGNYLPDDLSTLKRRKPGLNRAAGDVEVTLEEELAVLVEDFTSEFQAALPNPEKALTLDFVEGTDEGLLIGGDMIVPYNSIEGAITVELFNALADGEDLEKVIANLETELSDVFGADEGGTDRGVVRNGGGRWPKGVLNYRWGALSSTHKAAVQDAMKTWTSKTGNKVKFSELASNAWNDYQLQIKAIGVINIYDVSTTDFNGKATVGYSGGTGSYLKLNKEVAGIYLQRTALHELGHCIGLYHEHQRYDRDEWISVTGVSILDPDYFKLPKSIPLLRWEWKRVRILWWTISVPYLVTYQQPFSTLYGPFDFDSVMLYSTKNITVKKVPSGNKTLKVGGEVPRNTVLSAWDIETAKRIY
jgi:hypothetical protein